jgi:ATP-dependent 26S proteasome regulatory subunit
VLYTGDSAVLQNDEVFLEFIAEMHSAFVVEDADHLLTPRSGGNQTLHRFLNIADGIASAHGKKIIFSTNLPNMRDIDEALIRPGRCFAHLYLQELQAVEAIRLLDRLCADDPNLKASALTHLGPVHKKSYSVAEVYAAHRNAGSTAILAQLGAQRDSARVAFGFN